MKRQKWLRNTMIWMLALTLAVTMSMPLTAAAAEENTASQNGTVKMGASAEPGAPAEQTGQAGQTEQAEQVAPVEPAKQEAPGNPDIPAGQVAPAEPTEPAEPEAPAVLGAPADQTGQDTQTNPGSGTDTVVDPTDPTEPQPEPPKYFSVYRVEVKNGVMRCYWYNKKGEKAANPQKKKYFIVKFDKGSKTSGRAIKKVGKKGVLYYFGKKGKGKKYTGWFKQKKKKYYFKKGKRLRGTKKVKGIWYQFSKKNGRMLRKIGDGIDKKFQSYTSRSKYMIVVKLKEHRVRVYKGKKNKWDRIHKFKCTVGASSTPTVKGTFTIGSRGRYFNTGVSQRCWYWTQFYGNYLFHSVIYDRSPSPSHIVDGRLGINASHGCIRLALSNARWINRTIPSGTKVIIY